MFGRVFNRSSPIIRLSVRTITSLNGARASVNRPLAKTLISNGNHIFNKKLYLLGLFGITSGYYFTISNGGSAIINDENVNDDASKTVSVDSSISPLPVNYSKNEYSLSNDYSLLGYGIRAVTFLKFKIYALGIYVADEDIKSIAKLFSTSYLSSTFIDTDKSKSHPENVKEALNDPKKSLILIGNLLDSGIKMMAKITPVRNTDFNHLRDGITKTVLNHPNANEKKTELENGLAQLKETLSNKGSVAKNDDLFIELKSNGSLVFTHNNRKKNKAIHLGTVTDPIVGKFLFSQYIGGPKPLSPPTKETVTDKIYSIV
ncbi:hypothetical protein Kpol_1000p25 [Vanderwaltozyma polyspora DSM 70294]|uniref:Altered inheritance of mitochondria protein 18, mitochondrial n=1 Tax=Vanderwaltozyma polyspora (strain ATCC 22028 / DSM 70294 / BCRC 21397 / CBS 2163 / NBRC 10782 / NRRL Y-8283 / UCD 57-17) TaxID=436907 RepID=AIM18_VANPO|nr:uncharacterized protein Kpol_1000p25 [Vanderwaltozyma polyspora DSM 70294]A7TPW4.1 RecName: Full=Altered inheritance of mitochondria protein 18, mitochondrial; Flags: Precursor [Vanderwaltozyma polyspora DSM 70294]EDO15712.1 hypothetical protein Kpol_1000p25 [Vanderwaltozyma polyspora DSM 70294]